MSHAHPTRVLAERDALVVLHAELREVLGPWGLAGWSADALFPGDLVRDVHLHLRHTTDPTFEARTLLLRREDVLTYTISERSRAQSASGGSGSCATRENRNVTSEETACWIERIQAALTADALGLLSHEHQ